MWGVAEPPGCLGGLCPRGVRHTIRLDVDARRLTGHQDALDLPIVEDDGDRLARHVVDRRPNGGRVLRRELVERSGVSLCVELLDRDTRRILPCGFARVELRDDRVATQPIALRRAKEGGIGIALHVGATDRVHALDPLIRHLHIERIREYVVRWRRHARARRAPCERTLELPLRHAKVQRVGRYGRTVAHHLPVADGDGALQLPAPAVDVDDSAGEREWPLALALYDRSTHEAREFAAVVHERRVAPSDHVRPREHHIA